LISRKSIRAASSAILGQGVAQGVNALGAIIRIPVLVVALSAAGYGTFSLVMALAPWLLLPHTALRYSVRVLGADALHSGSPEHLSAVIHEHRSQARRFALWFVAAAPVLGAAIALSWPALSSPSADRVEAFWVVVLSVTACATGLSGSVYTGWLEANDKLAATNLLGSLVGIIGLGLAVALAWLHGPFILFVAAGMTSSVAQMWGGWLVGRRSAPPGAGDPELVPTIRRNVRAFTVNQFSALIANGLSPFVVGAAVGAVAVGSYTIAARLAILITIVPSALIPLFWNQHARLRRASSEVADGPVWTPAHERMLLLQLMAGVGLAGVFWFVGPRIGHLLGKGDVPAAPLLYGAFAVFGIIGFLQAPLSAWFVSPDSVSYLARSTASAAVAGLLLGTSLALLIGESGPIWGIDATYAVLTMAWYRRVRSTRTDGPATAAYGESDRPHPWDLK